MRQTKIIATLGPASENGEVIRALVEAGVDVFRLNFSHGTHASHGTTIDRIRAAATASTHPVAILQDLSGPKIRTGTLKGGGPLKLNAGDPLIVVVGNSPGEPGRITTTFADLPRAVRSGDVLLLDDGKIQLSVTGTTEASIHTIVVDGGELGERKGINAPGADLPISGLTAKDVDDLRFGAKAGVDFVALSFVQQASDLTQARDLLREAGTQLPLVAKLERPQAVARLTDVLRASDAVMVARGDLGLELPLERVPGVQKQTTREARALGIPVIVATQVLESMRTELRPTRAEVSDAANAVADRVDAIMLAGETAIGAHPVRAVETLDRIIREAELSPATTPPLVADGGSLPPHGRAICEAAVTLAEHAGAAAIVAVTRGGKTARFLSALRPDAPIVAITGEERIARRLMLSWGVLPVIADVTGDLSLLGSRLGQELVGRGILPADAVVVLVSVTPDLAPGPSNFLKVHRVHA